MQVVKVDGTVFLGEMDEDTVVSAMQIDARFMSEDVNKSVVATYVKREHMDKLTNVSFGTTSAVQTRDLNVDEEQLFTMANFAMDVAVKSALRSIEVSYFEANFAGK